jgi:hypothetical protein
MTGLQVVGTGLGFVLCLAPSILLIVFRQRVVESIRRKAERSGDRFPHFRPLYQLVADGQSTTQLVVFAVIAAAMLAGSFLAATIAAIN